MFSGGALGIVAWRRTSAGRTPYWSVGAQLRPSRGRGIGTVPSTGTATTARSTGSPREDRADQSARDRDGAEGGDQRLAPGRVAVHEVGGTADKQHHHGDQEQQHQQDERGHDGLPTGSGPGLARVRDGRWSVGTPWPLVSVRRAGQDGGRVTGARVSPATRL